MRKQRNSQARVVSMGMLLLQILLVFTVQGREQEGFESTSTNNSGSRSSTRIAAARQRKGKRSQKQQQTTSEQTLRKRVQPSLSQNYHRLLDRFNNREKLFQTTTTPRSSNTRSLHKKTESSIKSSFSDGDDDSFSDAQLLPFPLLQQQQQQRIRRLSSGTSRIVGGNPVTDPTLYPYFALATDGSCGATLIHPHLLLTTAHCSGRFVWTELALGRLDRSTANTADDTVVETVFVVTEYIHPDYDPVTLAHDLMLVRLARSSTNVTPARWNDNPSVPMSVLVADDNNGNGRTAQATVLGFGRTSEGPSASSSDVLLEATVPLRPLAVCAAAYTSVTLNDAANLLCAGTTDLDACAGDSGGPLVWSNNNENDSVVVGLVSAGYGCGDASYPTVYTRVSAHGDWIRQMECLVDRESGSSIGNEEFCTGSNLDSNGVTFVPEGTQTASSRFAASIATIRVRYDNSSGPSFLHASCLAVLIHPDVLLTAASCIHLDDVTDDNVEIFLGMTDHRRSGSAERIQVRSTLRHPNFDQDLVNENDIMLVQLATPVPSSVATVLPMTTNSATASSRVTKIGFGVNPYTLLRTQSQRSVLDPDRCRDDLGGYDQDMCVDAAGDACVETLGAPLLLDNNEGLVIVGVAGAYSCGSGDGTPGFYSDVSYYKEWIERNMCDLTRSFSGVCATGVVAEPLANQPSGAPSRAIQPAPTPAIIVAGRCPAEMACGDLGGYYLQVQFFGLCLSRCVNFFLALLLNLGWSCGFCPAQAVSEQFLLQSGV